MASSPSITATFCATLVDEWVSLGLRTAIVSPGSRSTPMALALVARPEINVQVFHDERSAAFAALGVGLTTALPAMLLCTSGTAAVEFHPAVVEAHEARVPMLVCTADRPPELHGVGAPQTIDQRNLYGVAARLFEDPGVPDDDGVDDWRSLARRVVVASIGVYAGPVHLNLAFREPLVASPTVLPSRTPFDLVTPTMAIQHDDVEWVGNRCGGARGVIVAGRGVDDADAVVGFAERVGWPLIADPRSGCRQPGRGGTMLVVHADALLRTSFATRSKPDVVLRFGEPPASKVVTSWLAATGATQIVVSPSSAVHDPERVVDRTILADIKPFVEELQFAPAPTEWGASWRESDALARLAIESRLDAVEGVNEPLIARTVARHLPAGSMLVVSSSMPVRDVEWFAPVVVPEVVANRGANGIDGVVSTAVGVALARATPVSALVGDIAFVHDSNALLGLKARDVDIRVVVVDNDGGGIFSFLPQAESTELATFEKLWGTPHGVDLSQLVAAHGIRFCECSTVAELSVALAQRGPIVIRVRTDRHQNVAVHDALNRAVADVIGEGAL